MSVVISPSILNCDFGHFADELARISTADYVHVDVMDNHFVPNLALGLPLVEAAVHASPVPVDAHLMIEDPDWRARSGPRAGGSAWRCARRPASNRTSTSSANST